MPELYAVEALTGRKSIHGKLFYRVKWEGYPVEQSTWETVSHLKNVQDMVQEYDREHPIEGLEEESENKVVKGRKATKGKKKI